MRLPILPSNSGVIGFVDAAVRSGTGPICEASIFLETSVISVMKIILAPEL